MRTHSDVAKIFLEKNCTLLTTESEYNLLDKNKLKLKYIAPCGHTREINFYSFIKNIGILCGGCKKKVIKIINPEDRLKKIESEHSCINYFIFLMQNKYDIVKAFDCCKADIIFKPKNILLDEWVGIQMKSVDKEPTTNGYGFHLDKEYPFCIILCMCQENKRMWAFPYETVMNIKMLRIGKKKSKYNEKEVINKNLFEKFNLFYETTTKKSFSQLNTPIHIYQQREQEYRNHRENKIPFVKFTDNGMEGLVYDFKIGNLKVQEKVADRILNKPDMYRFCIYKSNGLRNGKKHFKLYDVGDNDLYWLNCGDKKHFYVIPESIMIENGYVGNENNGDKIDVRKFIQITPTTQRHSPYTEWLSDYLFDYENIDKKGLLYIIENCKPQSLENDINLNLR